jgi:hypothetical protein
MQVVEIVATLNHQHTNAYVVIIERYAQMRLIVQFAVFEGVTVELSHPRLPHVVGEIAETERHRIAVLRVLHDAEISLEEDSLYLILFHIFVVLSEFHVFFHHQVE